MDDNRQRIRKSKEEVADCLDQLDAVRGGAKRETKPRALERFKYRVREMTVELMQPSGLWQRYAVPSRNISSSGIGFLIGHFVYPGTRCRVHLKSIYNHDVIQEGRVMRCRYVEGSARLHEAGVRFDRPIDVAMFHRGSAMLRVLVIDPEPKDHKLVANLLRESSAHVSAAGEAAAGLEMLEKERFDIAIVGGGLPNTTAPELAKEIRRRGLALPMIAMISEDTEDARKPCLDAGYDACVAKPLNQNALSSAVRAVQVDPIVSSFIHEAAMAELIDQFVSGLRERIRELIAAVEATDAGELTSLLGSLRSEAAARGFDGIGAAARETSDLLAQNSDPGALRAKIHHLARLCYSARGASGADIREE